MSEIFPLLKTIIESRDVSALNPEQRGNLCCELREFLIHTIARKGGHFGSNLGVVELTVALHAIFPTPANTLVWDVGHQAYAHKVLTGRRDRLHTIRQKGGLSPFPKRSESSSDAFGVGHSSTSISAAVGMALAHRGKRRRKHVVAIIGDGALTGGMAYEALDHAGDAKADVLVVLNDNRMSISPNVGSMTKYLTRLISSPEYINLRLKGRRFFAKFPAVETLASRFKKQTKGMMLPSTLFEEMGFAYFGPIDGNDVNELTEVLANIKKIRGPRILHVVTRKGKGCVHAETDALKLHAVSSFDPKTGKKNGSEKQPTTYTDVFGKWVIDIAGKDRRAHVITPAMREGSGLVEFHQQFPDRFHDVGIAEQHAVTLAAGLACEKKKPIVAIYSTFLQRAYDQLIHDVALQNLDVIFAIDRAGVVGPDGATHAGSFDLSYLRAIPRMTILAPASGSELESMLSFVYAQKGPTAVRYPRSPLSVLPEAIAERNMVGIERGKACVVRNGCKTAILSFGALLDRCVPIAEEINATLVNMRFIKPIDTAILYELAKTHDQFITLEENAVVGGAGSAVNEYIMDKGLNIRVKNIGIPDAFGSHGTRDEVLEEAGLSQDGITGFIRRFLDASR